MKAAINRRKVFSILLSVLMVVGTLSVPLYADETATSMKLTSTEGKVTISNGLGKKVSPFKGMNLNNGYHVLTDTDSVARINMDDTKLATVGELSDVDISRQGEDLELRLNSGDVFVSVNQKIAKTATVKVRTANVVMGIAGTHVGAYYDPVTKKIVLFNTDGTARVIMRDHSSGQVVTYKVSGGDALEFDNPALDRAVVAGADTFPGLYARLRAMMPEDVTPSLADAAKNQPEVLEKAVDPLKNLNLNNPLLFKAKLSELLKGTQSAQPGSSGGISTGINSAFEEQESELKREEARAAEEAEKSRHHHDDDDEEVACAHVWPTHIVTTLPGDTDPVSGYPKLRITNSLVCTKCGATGSHQAYITSANYDSSTIYEWRCTCGATGRI